MINKKDEKILKHLKDINVQSMDHGSFIVNFVFETNDAFTDGVLSRTFTLDPVKQTINKITSTPIAWKSEDADPSVEKKKKNVKNSK